MRSLQAAAVAALLLPTWSPLHAQVSNPGFEKGETDWRFEVIVEDTKGGIDATIKHSGSKSYRIANGPSGRGYIHSKPFRVKPGAKYSLTVWAKAKGAPPKGVLARIFWFTGTVGIKSEEREFDDTIAAGGTFDWKKLTFKGGTVTSPSDASLAYIRLDSNDGGAKLNGKTDSAFTVWFDDVALKEQ